MTWMIWWETPLDGVVSWENDRGVDLAKTRIDTGNLSTNDYCWTVKNWRGTIFWKQHGF
jgi:hypothetical protein